MLRFCVNISMMFIEAPFVARFAAARRAGFAGVEIQSPYELSALAFATAAHSAGTEVVNFNTPRGRSGEIGIACLPGREAEFRDGVEKALTYARACRAPQLNVLMGLVPEGEDPARCMEVLAGNLAFAAEAFARAKVVCLTEPLNRVDRPGYLLHTVDETAALVRRIGHPNLKIEADIYHMGMNGEDVIEGLARNRDVIGHIQFADVPGRKEPGTGSLDFRAIFAAIEKSGYKGWISAEYDPSTSTEETLGWFTPWRAVA